METTHLEAIEDRLHREKARLEAAQSDQERAFRQVQVNAAEKERAAELKFLGMADPRDMSDDELLAGLGL